MNDIEEKMKPIEKQYLHSMSIEELNAYRIVKNLAKPTFVTHVGILLIPAIPIGFILAIVFAVYKKFQIGREGIRKN